ncbi:MAG: precorrin-6Y C5,15-methyltransferase subunit CbiT [Aphanocapsa lilacina HA4352-LM1]|nr:precorrin-6Y C5,15-methyltransferase subunit CbiT [Aphanocapsa lilacina HA4352-LM1]
MSESGPSSGRPWSYASPGIPDDWFERIPGIPLSPREVRVLMLSQLRLSCQLRFWDIGAGTGTLPVEAALLCPTAPIVAIERDAEVAELIERNCRKFGVTNVQVERGSAPECLAELADDPDRVCIEGGQSLAGILHSVWPRLKPGGRVVAVTSTLEGLYRLTEGFAELQARQVEVVQAGIYRLERRGAQQAFMALDPTFVLSGEKI